MGRISGLDDRSSFDSQANTKNYVGVNLGFSFGGGRRK